MSLAGLRQAIRSLRRRPAFALAAILTVALAGVYGEPERRPLTGNVVKSLRSMVCITHAGNVELIQTQGFGQALLGQRLLGEQGGHAVRTFLADRKSTRLNSSHLVISYA